MAAVVAKLCEAAHAEAKAKGHGFVGIAKILRQSVWKKPSSKDDRKVGFAAEAIRRVAASTTAGLRQMVTALKDFRVEHALAWAGYRTGERPTFPAVHTKLGATTAPRAKTRRLPGQCAQPPG